jgi:hypothetical protein
MRNLSVCLFFFLLPAESAIACDRSRIGPLEEHVSGIELDFRRTLSFLGQVPLRNRSAVENVKIKYLDQTERSPIYVSGGTIYYNRGFVRFATHIAIEKSFLLDLSVLTNLRERPGVLSGFRQQLWLRTTQDFEAFIFPQFIGMDWKECVERWTESDMATRVVTIRSKIALFWFLHEVAHVELGHLINAPGSKNEAWNREHEADLWAYDSIVRAAGFDAAIHTFRFVGNTFDIFSNPKNLLDPFAGSESHPTGFCRTYKIYEHLQAEISQVPGAARRLGELDDAWSLFYSGYRIAFEYGVKTGELSGTLEEFCEY